MSGTIDHASWQGLIALIVMLLGWTSAFTMVVWFELVAHEGAHVIVARFLGAEPYEVRIGGGAPALVLRSRRMVWDLRWKPTHGLVRYLAPATGWSVRKESLVALAGPVASTCYAGLFVLALVLTESNDSAGPDGLTFGLESTLRVATVVVSFRALTSWMPRSSTISGELYDSDVELVRVLRRMNADERAAWLDSVVSDARLMTSWRHFREGRYAEALITVRAYELDSAGDRKRAFLMPFYVWRAEGVESALRACAVVRDVHVRCASADDVESRRAQAADTYALDLNEAFFAALAGGAANLQSADERSRTTLAKHPREAAALRTRGFVDLELGDVKNGLARLKHAWRIEEDWWCRALCASYLAYGHALNGDALNARRYLAKCRRLDPNSPMLATLRPRIDAALTR